MTPPELAVFDFDGTLTRRDTFVPFLVRAAGPVATSIAFLRAVPTLARASRRRDERDAAKEQVVGRTLAGRPEAAVAAAGQAYADHLESTQLRPDVVARLRWHQARGHTCVLVSASLALYLSPLGRRLGVAEVLATELEVGEDGRLTGRFSGANCRGAEKLRRLNAAFHDQPIGWAYGDSVDDEVLLDRARHPVKVGRDAITSAGSPGPP